MLSAGRVQQQARHIWVAIGCSGHIDAAVWSSRELSSSSFKAMTVASGDCGTLASLDDADLPRSPAAFRDRTGCLNDGLGRPINGPIHCLEQRTSTSTSLTNQSTTSIGLGIASKWCASGMATAFRRCGLTPTVVTSGLISSALGRRMYHPWYYGTKLRNRVITSVSSLDQLANLLRQEGDKLDHVNLVVLLRQLQLLASHNAGKTAATSAPAAAAAGSGKVAAAVAAAASKAVEKQVEALVAQTARLVRRRTKWYDPRNAAAVVHCTAALGYTDGRVLNNMTARTIARLNEAYSRDLLVLLRGLSRHAKLSAASTEASAPASSGVAAAKTAAHIGTDRALRKPRYLGPPPQLLRGVRQFLLAKIPTGRMPPENIDGLMRYVTALRRNQRLLDGKLLTTVEADLRVRLSIYAPKPLAGVLHVLAAGRHPVAPDLLDAAAEQFVVHADTYGTGMAAARFLTAASTLIQDRGRRCGGSDAAAAAAPGGGEGTVRAAGPAEAAAPAPETASSSAAGGGGRKGLSPARWLAGKPELLALCFKLMTRDLSGPAPNRLVDWMAVLIRSEVPLASLASAATPMMAPSPSTPATPPTATGAAVAPAPAPTVTAMAVTAGHSYAAVATAASTFVKAHSVAVEKVVSNLSPDAVVKLRKMYDTYGLTYPKGL